MTSAEDFAVIGSILNDSGQNLTTRFRALFTLRNLGGASAVAEISQCFHDDSALLKHECAYCLGQMQDEQAIDILRTVLADKMQQAIVRHEAGEALGALGCQTNLDILLKHSSDSNKAVSETCELAVSRLRWLTSDEGLSSTASCYTSVDPAPPSTSCDISVLRGILLDANLPLFHRYRAMFALRNIGGEQAALTLTQGLQCKSSALFRHEVAFVLGQMRDSITVPQLCETLADSEEATMVRHEAAEALGSIANDACRDMLTRYIDTNDIIVRDSCRVALDMLTHETSEQQFQYADTLAQIHNPRTV